MGQMSSSERLVRLLGAFALVVSMVTYATGETLAGAGTGSGAKLERTQDSESESEGGAGGDATSGDVVGGNGGA